jgi:4'-phosphopantetheinyl transferase
MFPSTAPGTTATFQLPPDEVHCWCVSLDVAPETSARLHAILDSGERYRLARLRFRRDREQFIASHGILRHLLGRYLQNSPERISYRFNALGKPELNLPVGSRLKFNLSHSNTLALIAIAAEANVGVDLERIPSGSDHLDIARSFFSAAETDQLSALPARRQAKAFALCWTRREACVKVCGGSLAIAMEGLSAPVADEASPGPVEVRVPAHEHSPEIRCSVFTLQPAAGYVGALAVEGSGWRLVSRRWETHPG